MNFPDSVEQVEAIISRAKDHEHRACEGIGRFQTELDRLEATLHKTRFILMVFESLKESWTLQDPEKDSIMRDKFFLLAPDQEQRVVAKAFLPPDMQGYQTTGEWNEKHCRLAGHAPSYPIVDLSSVASLTCTKCASQPPLPIIEMLGVGMFGSREDEKFTLCLHCGEKKVIATAPYEQCEQLVAS